MALPAGAERASQALSVERSSAVRRALNEIKASLEEETISRDEAAKRVVGVVEAFGLQPVALEEPPRPIDAGDLGVVCWMGVVDF